jgi:hypothetical protein
VSGSGLASGGDGMVCVSRELWASVLVALEHGDAALRAEVYAEVVRLGFPAWQADLDDPGALAGHVREVTGLSVCLDDGAGPVPDGWAPCRPRLSPIPAASSRTRAGSDSA